MKALVYTDVEELTYRDEADATPRKGEELIKISFCGICGSDMHAYLGHDERRPAPLILGHEGAGHIVGGARDGERVTINPLVTNPDSEFSRQGRTNLCVDRQIISMMPRPGAFADYVSIPPENLVIVPDDVPLEKAALAEPIAVSWHAVRLGLIALHPTADRSTLIIGGGAIGVAAYLSLLAQGEESPTIVEPNAKRRKYLEANGFNVIATAEGAFGIVVDAVGYAATRATASALVMPGGVILHIGLGEDASGLDIRRMTLQEITFIGTYTYTAQDFRDTAAAIFDGRLGPLDWTETRALKDGWQAFQDIRAGEVLSPKIVLQP
ncbi:MAG: alcohol dehydrogenase catalytic domain-containing protein [Pseudomonadota bacterium]